jgi:hypothetical protein
MDAMRGWNQVEVEAKIEIKNEYEKKRQHGSSDAF